MEPTADLSVMLTALMFGAMLAAYTQVVALRRKGRDDRRRYERRMRRSHGDPWHERQAPPDA